MALWRNRLALVKAESTYGTNPTPAATDALLFTELDVTPLEMELIERETIQSYFGNRQNVIGQFNREAMGGGVCPVGFRRPD